MQNSERASRALWLLTLAITNVFVAYVAFGLGSGLMAGDLAAARADRDGLERSLAEALSRCAEPR
jgi:hypothetical protein